MLHGLAALDGDPATSVIVLVSKPPSPDVAAAVPSAAEASEKPVVVIFLGADPASVTRTASPLAAYLAQAADMAVALSRNETRVLARSAYPTTHARTLSDLARSMAPSQRYVRGIFSGGTFASEASCIAPGISAHSNTPVKGNTALVDIRKSQENTIVDMGDDDHPGPATPDDRSFPEGFRIREEVADPTTAVAVRRRIGFWIGRRPDRRVDLHHRNVRRSRSEGRTVASSGTCAAPTSIPGSGENRCGTEVRGRPGGHRVTPGGCLVSGVDRRAKRSQQAKKSLRSGSEGRQRRPAGIRQQHHGSRRPGHQPPGRHLAGADAALGWTLANLVGDPRIADANRTAYDRLSRRTTAAGRPRPRR